MINRRLNQLREDPLSPYRNASHARKAAGYILIDNRVVADTLQCVHCYKHFIARKDASDPRCNKCDGWTCGKTSCIIRCIPKEAFLEHLEGKRNQYSANNPLIIVAQR